MNEKEFYTVDEFAEHLRIHPKTVYNAIRTGRVQAFRTGLGKRSSYRIPHTEINRICELDMLKLINDIVDEKLKEKNGIH